MNEISALQSVTQKAGITEAATTQSAPPAGQVDFASMVAQVASQASETIRVAEVASQAGIKGQMPLVEVVDKVLEAERSLNSAIAVRDKVVAAYLELSRMQI